MSVKQINDMTKRLTQSPQRVRTAAAMDAMQGMDMQSTMGSQATVSSTASSSRRISKREEQVLQGWGVGAPGLGSRCFRVRSRCSRVRE